MKILLFFCGLFLTGSLLHGQDSPTGIWKTVDDNSGEERSRVEIYQQDGKFYGKIIALLDEDSNPDDRCTECKGDKKNQLLIGLVVIEELEPYKDYWKSGSIMDPENGNTYRCSVWFENGRPDELKVRGKHWTGIYRTQTWYRVK